MTTTSGSTVEAYILNKCPWYYDFEAVFYDHPGVNSSLIIETGQLPRRHGQPVEKTALERFNNTNNDAESDAENDAEGDNAKGDNAEDDNAESDNAESDVEKALQKTGLSTQKDEKASDSDISQHSAHSLTARAIETAGTAAATPKEAEKSSTMPSIEKNLLPPLDEDDDYSWLDEPSRREPRMPKTPIPYRAKTVPADTVKQSSTKPTPKAHKKTPEETPKAALKDTTKDAPKNAPKVAPKVRNKSKRGREDSDSEEDTEKSRRDRWKKTKGRLTMAESMLEEAKINDSRLKEEAEKRQQQYHLTFQQREQHHTAVMADQQVLINQSAESLLRVQIEAKKQEQQERRNKEYIPSNGEFDMELNNGFRPM